MSVAALDFDASLFLGFLRNRQRCNDSHDKMDASVESKVVLRIGERQFFTTKRTLAQSRLLSALWIQQPPEQEEYFLDADPGIFEHVLRYLRTRRFPLFYDRANGHDLARYLELLEAARFYKIDSLESWLADKRYLTALWITTKHVTAMLYGDQQVEHMQEIAWKSHESGQILALHDKRAKAWRCPDKQWRHDGDKFNCVRANCNGGKSLPDSYTFLYTRVVEVTAIVTSVQVREDALLGGSEPELPPPYYAQ